MRQALGGDVFIWGPPGTGKTQTIGAIVSELLRDERSVLLVSHTNSAVDGGLARAVTNLARLDDGGPGYSEGDLVRVGVCKDRRLQDDPVGNRPPLLARSIARRRSAEREQELAAIEHTEAAGHERASQLRRLLELDEFYSHARPELATFRTRVELAEATQAQLRETSAQLAEAQATLRPLEPQFDAIARIRGIEAHVAQLEQELSDRRRALGSSSEERQELEVEVAGAEELLQQAEASGGLTRLYRRLPRPADQRETVAVLRTQLETAGRSEDQARQASVTTIDQIRARREEIEAARLIFAPASPDDVIRRTQQARSLAEQLGAAYAQLRADESRLGGPLRAELQERLSVLAEERFTRPIAATTELRLQLEALDGCVEQVGAQIENFDAGSATAEISELERSVEAGRVRAGELKERIAQAEAQVITDARLIATTLTGAYLRDAIVQRTFDVVILDEASMASIPSLFFAAGLATDSAVVVGDFRQLPPIVISEV